MKIGIVTTWFERGAAYVSRQFRNALTCEHEVYIYARGGEAYAQDDPAWNDPWVTWAKRSLNPKATTFHLGEFRRWIETHSLDLVFFNEQHWWKPVAMCAEMGVKTGAYVDYYTEKTVPIFGLYDFLICNTRRHLSAFDWHPGAHYVPWGTDLELFRAGAQELVTPDTLTFFHSCGWDPFRKGTELVLRAFSRLEGPCRLVVHSQVPLSPELLSDKRVQVHQETVPAPGLFHLGDVYVYPTRLEGLGLTLTEALASGLPIVTTDHGPMNELLTPETGRGVGVTRLHSRYDGYYWPVCQVDEDHLRQVMQEMVDGRASMPALKRSARAYAEKNLNWRENATRLPELFAQAPLRADPLKSAAVDLARAEDLWWYTPIGDFITQVPPLMMPLQAIVRFRAWLRQRSEAKR